MFSFCSPRLTLTTSLQISGQNKSEAIEPEGLVKITYGIVASFLFKRAEIQIRKFFWIVYKLVFFAWLEKLILWSFISWLKWVIKQANQFFESKLKILITFYMGV